MRLLEALVDLVLLYGAEMWGCCYAYALKRVLCG